MNPFLNQPTLRSFRPIARSPIGTSRLYLIRDWCATPCGALRRIEQDKGSWRHRRAMRTGVITNKSCPSLRSLAHAARTGEDGRVLARLVRNCSTSDSEENGSEKGPSCVVLCRRDRDHCGGASVDLRPCG